MNHAPAFVDVAVVQSSGNVEQVAVNSALVGSVWPLRANGEEKSEQAHSRLNLATGEQLGIRETKAEFLALCRSASEERPR